MLYAGKANLTGAELYSPNVGELQPPKIAHAEGFSATFSISRLCVKAFILLRKFNAVYYRALGVLFRISNDSRILPSGAR